MVSASVMYSFWSMLPPVVVSLGVPGLLAFMRVISVVSPVLICRVVVTIK